MPYDYSPKVLERWDFSAQAETYRLKFLHQQQETHHWKGRALAAESKLSASTPAPAGTTNEGG